MLSTFVSMKKVIYLAIFAVIAACNAKPDKHELLYNSTADSLRKYRNNLQEAGLTVETKDCMKLNYSDFKSKYHMTDSDMDAFAHTCEVTYSIAATLRAIEENQKLFDDLSFHSDTVKADYSFNKELPPAGTYKNEDAEIKVLQSAFDETEKSAKKK